MIELLQLLQFAKESENHDQLANVAKVLEAHNAQIETLQQNVRILQAEATGQEWMTHAVFVIAILFGLAMAGILLWENHKLEKRVNALETQGEK